MKKTLLLSILMTFSLFVNAQSTDDSNLKSQAKAISTELNFNPFKGNLSLNNSLNQVKIRYFITEALTLRLGFHVSNKDSVSSYGNPYGIQGNYTASNRKSKTLGVNFGIEKHFKGTKRLSPYIGVEGAISKRSASQDLTNSNYSISVKDGWIDVFSSPGSPTYISKVLEISNTQYGISAIAGFDFYMAKNFFFGYEFSMGYGKTDFKNPDISIIGQGITNPNAIINNSTHSFGTSLMNGIRIGYSF